MTATLKAELIAKARAEGFAGVGVTRPDAVPEIAGRLAEFVANGWQGDMAWMGERMAWRGDPTALWPAARSVIMLAETYTPDEDPMAVVGMPDRGAVSVYARNRDYHDIVKKRLKRVGRWLIERAGPGNTISAHSSAGSSVQPPQIKVFVDTAPVMEKPLAAAAGLGWQGKHTNLLSRELGNWFFLGAIFTTLELEPDRPGEDHCGSCTACLDACPTDAFVAPGQLDARRCISYLTIEHKGPVDEALRGRLGNRIYGCDDCLAACPWNKFARKAQEVRYAARDDLAAPSLAELAGLDDAAFRARFSGSPIKRIGRARFLRNVAYAIGNSGEEALAGAVRPLASDPDEVLSDAARWALSRLSR